MSPSSSKASSILTAWRQNVGDCPNFLVPWEKNGTVPLLRGRFVSRLLFTAAGSGSGSGGQVLFSAAETCSAMRFRRRRFGGFGSPAAQSRPAGIRGTARLRRRDPLDGGP